MPNILVFAGTTEGRELLEALSRGIDGSNLSVYACVATDYGKDMLAGVPKQIQIQSGRLTEDEMAAFMAEKRFDLVIDTTHPYARLASENIRAACHRAGCSYIRVLRSSGVNEQMNCLFFSSHEETAAYLNRTDGNVLLTIGSKELAHYTQVRDYDKRLYLRVLPMQEVVESCSKLGFPGRQLICMQGPFTAELNAAMIRQVNARCLVTKDSGEAGGFAEKYQAAEDTGTTLLVIGRETVEEGITAEALLKQLETAYAISLRKQDTTQPGQWFPLFTNISGKTITVVGAGKIAGRRIETLLKFDCRIRVVAPEFLPEISDYAEARKLELLVKSFEASDLEGADYVLAATNNTQVNDEVYETCRICNLPVNVANDKGKSDFYFPGIVRRNGITVGITAEGRDHALAKRATTVIAACLDRNLQEGETIGTEKN